MSLEYFDLHQKLVHLGYDLAACGLSYHPTPPSRVINNRNDATTTAYNHDTMESRTLFANPGDASMMPQHNSHSLHVADPAGYQPPPAPDTATATSSTLPIAPGNLTDQGRFTCTVCNKSFARPGDLRRHGRYHDASARKHGCPVPECPYAGDRGFLRCDKLLCHVRARHPGVNV